MGTKSSSTKTNKNIDQITASLKSFDNNELSAQREPLKIFQSEFIKIDHATLLENIALISGWMSESVQFSINNTLKFCDVDRPDADAAVQHKTKGFIVVIALEKGQSTVECNLKFGENHILAPIRFSASAEEITLSMQFFLSYSRDFLPYFSTSRLMSVYLSKNCREMPLAMRSNKRNGHLDIVRTFPGFGYIVFGWALKKETTDFWLVSDDGHWHPLKESIRFNRPDVTDAFVDTFGVYATEAGFFCIVKNTSIESEMPIRLIAAINGGLFILHQSISSSGPQTPLAYAKWAFGLSTPVSKFFDRLNQREGELIEHLISQNRAGYSTGFEVWKTSNIPSTPRVSIIVPLYARADFVEYQLAQFSRDPEFRNGTIELIYVVDDPALVEPLLLTYHQLFKIYGVPFQIIWGKTNRGYSGANNLGLKIARGDSIILLNSDVFPIHNGWVGKMIDELSDESIGAVGARLDFADGSVQHQGMAFEHSDELNVWLNEHPMRGLNVPVKESSYDVEAATGACLAMRRSDLLKIGGMDEGFLIGDFEDSDLCMKLRGLRGRIVIAGGIRLIHLERQSFTNLGSNDFRSSVVKFNAWRHNRLWGSAIAALKEEAK